MAQTAILKIDILADARKATDAFGKAGGAASGFGSTLKKVAAAAVGAFAVREVVQFGASAVKAAEESQVATARLATAMGNAGDATGQAAKEAADYASALSLKIGVEDEAIMNAQSLLATFHAVSGEAGRQAGIFDRATAAAADMAANGYGNLETNAVQLGKALQDPVKGTAALGKAGVQFSDDQKEMIASLVESGDLLGAQKIILGEVEGQVGGTAAATATASSKMSVAFGEVKETIGNALLPVVETVAGALGGLMTDVLPKLSEALAPAMAKIQETAASVVAWFQENWPKIRDTATSTFRTIRDVIMPIVTGLAAYFTDTLLPALSDIWDEVVEAADDLAPVFEDIQTIAEEVFPVVLGVIEDLTPIIGDVIEKGLELVGWLADMREEILLVTAPLLAYAAAMGAITVAHNLAAIAAGIHSAAETALIAVMLMSPWMWMVVGIMALIAAVILIVKNWDKVKAAFQAVWDWVKKNWPLLLAILTGPIGAAVLLIVRNWDTIKGAIKAVFDWIKQTATDVWRWVTDKFKAIKDGIVDAFGGLVDIIKAPINGIIGILNGFEVPRVTIGGQDPLGVFGPSIPEVTIGGWGFPHIPRLEQGGEVLRTGFALVHAGETFSGVGRTLGGSTVVNVTVNAGGLGADSPEIQRAVVRALRGHVARNGPLDVPVRS